jgi:shikimate kinase
VTKVGEALAHGAITIINAIATGKGAALSVDLWTRAKVQLTDKPGEIEGRILSDPEESPQLIKNVVITVLQHFNRESVYGAKAETDSNIPIAKGLKSSSVAANALVLATAAALEEELDDLTAIKLGVEAALKSGVTITGAFDDASASYLGNAIVTDNNSRKIERIFEIKEDHAILIHTPLAKSYTAKIDVARVRLIAPQVEVAYREALKGDLWTALTLNGLLYSTVLGYGTEIVFEALSKGAVAAGLTGKGPATAIITPREKREQVKKALQRFEGKIIETRINREKAHATRR